MIKEKIQLRDKKGCFVRGIIPWNKGVVGVIKDSIETKKKKSEAHKGGKNYLYRKTYEEVFGKEKALEIKNKMAKRKIGVGNIGMNGKNHSSESRDKMSRNRKGKYCLEKHPNWQGGKSFEPYTKEFNNKFKRSIRKRDNQICMLCRIHREKCKRALDVHHINYDKQLSIPENCISLCWNCHLKTNFNRKNWIYFFQSLLSKKYGYKYSEKQEAIINIK